MLRTSEEWEAVYYTNPIPLSSRTLLAMALLFDRVHLPGVAIPQKHFSGSEKSAAIAEFDFPIPPGPDGNLMQPMRNLGLWAIEQPSLSSFVHLPDAEGIGNVNEVVPQALQLLDDTLGGDVSKSALNLCATESLSVAGEHVMAYTWPLYQANALNYATRNSLPLISDDLDFIPPLPQHSGAWDTKTAAQQLAVEAVSLVLPKFQSVEPAMIAEFRNGVQEMARPFRVEMVKMTADVSEAIVNGGSEKELKALCAQIAQSRILPALDDLSRQLKEPLRPWHKTALDVAELGLYAKTAAAGTLPEFILAWAIYRGGRIASEYAKVFTDREGQRKSGLGYLLKIQKPQSDKSLADWDRRDWRCSGTVDIPDPGQKLIPLNVEMAKIWKDTLGFETRTVRRIWQDRSASYAQGVPPAQS